MNSTDETAANLGDVASMRHKTYLLLGSLFHYPSDVEMDGVAVVADEINRDLDLIRSFPFFNPLNTLIEGLQREYKDGGLKLQSEHVGLFQIGTPETPCPPYESYYMTEGSHMAGWVMSQVERSYAAGGFTMTDTAKKELPDHIGHELQFMSLLCGRETEARDDSDLEQAAGFLRLQRMFLHQHLLSWIPRLTHKLRLVADERSLYHQLAEATNAFVVHDGDFVEAMAEAGIFSVEENGAR